MNTKTKLLILIAFISLPLVGAAQNRILKGRVVAFNKFPLEGIEIISKKSKTTTDEKGLFEIEIQKKDKIKIDNDLFFSYEQKIAASDNFLQINLIFDRKEDNISKAVNRGYFKQQDLDYALENLAKENNLYGLFSDVYAAIKYAIPEARMVNNSTGGTSFILRGETSIVGNNSALYLVNRQLVNDISYINTTEIREIKKLSNSQASLYGSRGGTGVISIETY